ncbi:hypothetical protein G4Y79_05250 [Phototrophicus methaneseepsis]|uniref:Uncharacterized protein n=1 Tax=Phototrophicus methaneseepsis TaxID=2710758 RepID=A0A7S8IFN5_9CHLR|nr:hypothetical protein [Phototrophicus methaneseepsis]QPC83787.1 hypothetical protein G4Y79_05250 [Phototrophicus methaneseepsis]
MTLDFYEVKIDMYHNNSYSHPAADITERVQFAGTTWETGVMDAEQRLGRPTRLNLAISNDDGAFFKKDVEQLVNNAFETWTGPLVPDGWSQNGVRTATTSINSEDSFGVTLAHFVTNGADIGLSQTVLTVGEEYTVTVQCSNRLNGSLRVGDSVNPTAAGSINGTGLYVMHFKAHSETFQIVTSGATDMTLQFVELRPRYPYGSITKNMNIRIRMRASAADAFQPVWYGKIQSVTKDWWTYSTNPAVQLTASDPRALLDRQTVEIPLQQAVRSDQIIKLVMDDAPTPWPYQSDYAVFDDISTFQGNLYFFDASLYYEGEPGQFTAPWVPDVQDMGRGIPPLKLIEQAVEAEQGRFYWDAHRAKFIFHNRYHDFDAPLAYTFNEDHIHDVVLSEMEDVINQQEVQYYPRRTGGKGMSIYTATNLPIRISAGQERVITAAYTDTGEPDARLTAIGPIVVRFSANTKEDGSGLDGAGHLIQIVETSPNRARITYWNPSGEDVYITYLQVFGDALYTYSPVSVVGYNAESAHIHDMQPGTLMTLDLVDNETDAQIIADSIVARYGTQAERVKQISVSLTEDDVVFARDMLALRVGNRVRIQNSVAHHDRHYIIQGIRHTPMPDQHVMTFILMDNDRYPVAKFDDVTDFSDTYYFAP